MLFDALEETDIVRLIVVCKQFFIFIGTTCLAHTILRRGYASYQGYNNYVYVQSIGRQTKQQNEPYSVVKQHTVYLGAMLTDTNATPKSDLCVTLQNLQSTRAAAVLELFSLALFCIAIVAPHWSSSLELPRHKSQNTVFPSVQTFLLPSQSTEKRQPATSIKEINSRETTV